VRSQDAIEQGRPVAMHGAEDLCRRGEGLRLYCIAADGGTITLRKEVRHMAALTKRVPTMERVGMFDRFDRLFDDWMKVLPLQRPMMFGRWWADDMVHVDEFRDDGTLVIRAELPGIDPKKDVDLTVSDGMLTIEAERHADKSIEEKGYLRRELRYGSFTRMLPLPAKVNESDIKASYTNGILEIRVPVPKEAPATKIPVGKS
jgi:HSP20 family protein